MNVHRLHIYSEIFRFVRADYKHIFFHFATLPAFVIQFWRFYIWVLKSYFILLF